MSAPNAENSEMEAIPRNDGSDPLLDEKASSSHDDGSDMSPSEGKQGEEGGSVVTNDSDSAMAADEVRKERIERTRNVGRQLEESLNDVKGSTNRLLGEISVYLNGVEDVSVAYLRGQANQRTEAQRLEEVEPDVAGTTARFYRQLQDQMSKT